MASGALGPRNLGQSKGEPGIDQKLRRVRQMISGLAKHFAKLAAAFRLRQDERVLGCREG